MRHSLRRYAAPVAAAAILSGIAASIIVGSGTGSSVADESTPASNSVSVNGLGRVAGLPDVLRLEIGVQRTGNDVNAALNAANDDVKRIKVALDKYDVDDKDIQTSQVSINPRYVGDGRVEGYEIFQSLTVKLRDLKRSGAAISDAAAAGGNATRINGVSFDIEDNAQLIADARDAAFADAKAKAEQYAKLAGRSLGKVSTISENTEMFAGPQPYYAADEAAATKASSVPIEAGSQQVTVNSSITWELS